MFSSRAFLTRFHEFSRRGKLIQERDKIIAAISGGVDSMVLLDLLAREREAFGLTIIVAHFNYQLRGEESDGDEQLVAQRARHHGFELYVERANTADYAKSNKIGIQEAARNLRYEFFDKLLLSSSFDRIATAHTADDNAETMLLNMFRGAGVAGLAGIPVFREDRRVIRPLLFADRKEIEAYAAEEHLAFRNDSSNSEDHYTRNFIRHHILPPVKERINPNVVSTLQRSADLFRELEGFLTHTAQQNYELVVVAESNQEVRLSIPRLRSNPKLIQQYIVMLVAQSFANTKLDYDDVYRILDLTDGLTGSWVAIDKEHVVYRDRDFLVMRHSKPAHEFRFAVMPNHRYDLEGFSFSSAIIETTNAIALNGNQAEYVDADKFTDQELVLRTWKEGDAFVPLGMKTKKKISDFFVDQKVPVFEKHQVPILETKNGEIVWLCGHRIDDRFKVTRETRRVLKLEFTTNGKADATKED